MYIYIYICLYVVAKSVDVEQTTRESSDDSARTSVLNEDCVLTPKISSPTPV